MTKKLPSTKNKVPVKEKRFWVKEVILPIILALIASGGIIVTLISSYSKSKLPSPNESIRVQIQDDYYHIGDVEAVTVIQDGKIVGVTPFSHSSPQSNPFEKEFELPYHPKSATLFITARSVDPNEKDSAVKIFFNGKFFDFLNRYFTVETMDEKTVFISVDTSLLREGKNTFQIFVEASPTGFFVNIDDTEFRNVYLEIIP